MNELAEFFRKKKGAVAQLESEGAKMLQDWLEVLGKLNKQLIEWLGAATHEGLAIKPYSKEIAEERLGTYQAPALEVTFGGIKMRVEPVARFVVGGYGRVDIDSRRGIFKLILDDKGAWLLVRRSLADAEPLTESSFSKLVQEIFA